MNPNTGDIKAFESREAAVRAGYTIELSKEQARELRRLPREKRMPTFLGYVCAVKHKPRREKYPGQSTAYLVGANR